MRCALLIACFAACGSPEPGEGTVVLGTGETEFEPLVDDQELVVIAGPQGGHHFIVHAKIDGMQAGDWQRPLLPINPYTTFRAFFTDGTQIANQEYQLGYRLSDDGLHELPSGRLMIIAEANVPDTWGQPVTISVDVRDENGVTATDSVRVIGVMDPSEPLLWHETAVLGRERTD